MTNRDQSNVSDFFCNENLRPTARVSLHQKESRPIWLLFVIEDLIQACKQHNLQLSAEVLEEALLLLESDIFQTKGNT